MVKRSDAVRVVRGVNTRRSQSLSATCHIGIWVALLACMAMLVAGSSAHAFDLDVVDANGSAVSGFRWLVEKDETYDSQPGVSDPNTLAVSFHRSYMPVVLSGETAGSAASIPVPVGERYFVSVLPYSGYTMSGTSIAAGQTSATVVVHELPIPPAQITVFVFEDIHPINNAPDIPEEFGLEGFKVTLVDAGGRYGVAGGQMMADFNGNPLGTTYNEAGDMVMMGSGVFFTDAEGRATIKNLAPGKYTVKVVPPAGEEWMQTSTIEGGKGVDAWVKANEPSFFVEFGPPGEHVFIGFVRPTHDTEVLSGGSTISGRIVNMHNSRPPEYTFHPGHPFPGAWVGLNDLSVAGGRAVHIGPCDDESNFSIPDVPPGNYQLAVFDENLDIIFAFLNVTVEDEDLDLGDVMVFNWFGRFENYVFNDLDEDGFRDPDETGIVEQAVNIRWRDGTVYQSAPTDLDGYIPHEEVFPFFNWLVAEVDFLRFKATGATFIVDAGGPVLPDAGWDWPSRGVLNPQPQFMEDGVTQLINPNTGNNLSRTEVGPVLTQGMQVFLGQTNFAEWGKSTYDVVDIDNEPRGNFPGPEDTDFNDNGLFDPSNGGISGIVFYATTRAENDPRFAVAEEWEPGIPRVQVNLYADYDQDAVIDDWNGDGIRTLADVDNYPFGNFPGPEDIDRPENGDGVYNELDGDVDNEPLGNFPGEEDIDRGPAGDGAYNIADGDADRLPFGNFPGAEDLDYPAGGPGTGNGVLDMGDALNVVTTDSWDDDQPTNAQGPDFIHEGVPTDAYDGLRCFNQLRPAVFDGGYAFTSHFEGEVELPWVPEGVYIVEAVPPPGYEILKEEDKNVDFGETYTPVAGKSAPLLLPPPCVGDAHVVPVQLTLFSGVDCEFANQTRPLSNRKHVTLIKNNNAACDFSFFTKVPVSGHIVGMILDDLANEFDPNAPTFGEKYAPPWLPISIRDWKGNEISRVYSDEFGTYNALVPSTYTANIPMPSGMSPNMLTVVLNHPGPILDNDPGSPTYGDYIQDPFFNRQYSQFSYTFQYMPGTTTYLDTPVVPISAYAGPDQYPLDLEFPAGTPVVYSVQGPTGLGPYVDDTTGYELTITSAGYVDVPNPLYTREGPEPKNISRDFTFGPQGPESSVKLGDVELIVGVWTEDVITATVPAGTPTGQLIITRDDNGRESTLGVTVTVGPIAGNVINVAPSASPDASQIQDAIDAADAGDLLLVAPGVYNESVIMWKPVQLQGWGAFSTIINAVKVPAESTLEWRQKVQTLVMDGHVDLLPGQEINFAGVEPDTMFTEEGAVVAVLARNAMPEAGGFGEDPNARIDGLTLTGADNGGGIHVNGYARYLEISNCRVSGNQGVYGGGVRLGHPTLTYEGPLGLDYDDSHNDYIRIHNNQINGNGSFEGAGAGISIYTGADHYEVVDNFICGNFSQGHGGGIGHMGKSDGGLIADNVIIFNETFNQGQPALGGGIYIGGGVALEELSPGSGSVRVVRNLLLGNQAGAGDGGGIAAAFVNGMDVAAMPDTPARWYYLALVDNIIVNNMAGLAGGGIALQDVARSFIAHNTIAHNDSTATAALAFPPGNPNVSDPQPAGVVSRAHSGPLANAFGAAAEVLDLADFSNPEFLNNIVWKNRAFYFENVEGGPFGLQPDPNTPIFADLAVLGAGGGAMLSPRNCVLTDLTGYGGMGNISEEPEFVADYFNGDRGQTIIMPEVNSRVAVAAAFDEGGNFIDVRFGPLTLHNPTTLEVFGDYHLQSTSPARDIGTSTVLPRLPEVRVDIDHEIRPNGGLDAGADEYYPVGATNSAPIALPDAYSTRMRQRIRVDAPGILANDSDANGDPLTPTVVDSPDNGVLSISPDGAFAYIPNKQFAGIDTFQYLVSDGIENSTPVTVTLKVVTSRVERPVGEADAYSTEMDTPLAVEAPGVLENDADPDGDSIMALLVGDVKHGTLTLYADGSFDYTPDAGFVGTDTFRYRPCNDQMGQAVGVTIEVLAPPDPSNNPPEPQAAAIMTLMNASGFTRVLPHDPDPDDVHTYAVTADPANGTATITPTGILTYAPDMDYMGMDMVEVTVTDYAGAAGVVMVNVEVMEMHMPPGTGVFIQCPPDTDGIDTDEDGDPDNDNVCVHLSAGDGFARMADGTTRYMFGFGNLSGVPAEMALMEGMLGAETPSPTIVVREGQKLYLNLTNVGMMMRPDLFDPHTVHWHGFPEAAPVFDGVPDASISINMGGTLTYFYNVVQPGTYLYHCHVEATEHMQMGMIGNLWVTPKQDGTPHMWEGREYTKFAYNDGDGSTGYDIAYPVQLTSWDREFHEASLNVQPLPFAEMEDDYGLINGRGYPDTVNPAALPAPEETGKTGQEVSSLITADSGQRVLLRISNVSTTRFFTLTSPAIPMTVVGISARHLKSPDGANMYYDTNSITIGGGESIDVILDLDGVAPGTYPLYTTNLNYLSNADEDFGGMMTEIVVN